MRIGQNQQPRIGNGEHPLVSWGTVFPSPFVKAPIWG